MERYWRSAARVVGHGALLLYLLSVTACSALRRPLPEPDRSADGRILTDVSDRLEAERATDLSNIRVEVDGGVVLLYGSVQGIGAWECAIRNAELVPGVRTVADFLVIGRGPRVAPCKAPRDPT
ncbi:MAG: BON domain-containing protein [Gemmatimonas sp.]|nr:BON domain-containing protein [Gemmatimonas sp.]